MSPRCTWKMVWNPWTNAEMTCAFSVAVRSSACVTALERQIAVGSSITASMTVLAMPRGERRERRVLLLREEDVSERSAEEERGRRTGSSRR